MNEGVGSLRQPQEAPEEKSPVSIEDKPESLQETLKSPEVVDESKTSQVELLETAITGAENDLAKIQGLEGALGVRLPHAVGEKQESIASFKKVFDNMTGELRLSREDVGDEQVFELLEKVSKENKREGSDVGALYDDFVAQYPEKAGQYKDQYSGIAGALKQREAKLPEEVPEPLVEAPRAASLDAETVSLETMTDEMSVGVEDSDAAPESLQEQKALGMEPRLLEDININARNILKHAENLQNSLYRLDRTIDDMPSSRNGFDVGKKLEESSLFIEIKQQVSALVENASSMKGLPSYRDGENVAMKESIDMLSKGIRERQAEIQLLAKRMDAFYQGVSILQKKISDFYNGRNNADEDALRKFQGQTRVAFGYLKDLDRAYRNQELMLADLRQDKSI